MSLLPYFSSSSKVWESRDWIFGIEEIGYTGWEIVADGNYRLDDPVNFAAIRENLASTDLLVTVHAPYSDLNLASLNYPIWRESIRQICCCICHAAELTDRVTIHPGFVSPMGKLVPEKVWEMQKTALVEIGRYAEDHGVLACVENMINIRDFLCRYPEEILGLTEGILGIGITLDVGHANTNGQVDAFLKYVGEVDHLHIHDNHGQSDEHLALGDGVIAWEKVGQVIARDYSGPVVIEGRTLEEAKRSLAAFRKWFV
ncbi:MAG TPA: sugar phosphate isomerase/epimerase family protein [Candidatus Methanoculleus thermohydrogenotrophicum]|jgi:sugar phosphate isomerase/epimerase|nr:sugar phosphate isomerase/epimerase family protein [Candidatus Methanoculleus thermohydrogenotrophicum]NLM82471.1 sugar phosphate isomerase/epimerase [Candidatus Methanoculleus thermohydrogenotrophicum]HOB18574.1 sugar phosphate isomerase/epimerase family protein [Candidatus Methanoculleus thermohydrogenotrophicum]HPZ38706.1 sugar phosphate isomerase/epimerase family protein [Candidatus Methanoculleus thermohydrogenotrophicum]HQC91880.1 sugar phosphate isomerase/epimerase family protein [Can